MGGRQLIFRIKIGQSLDIGYFPSKLEILDAIPKQFETGSSRDIVIKKIYEIDPKRAEYNQQYAIKRDRNFSIEFYTHNFYGAFYLFEFEDDLLIKIHNVGS